MILTLKHVTVGLLLFAVVSLTALAGLENGLRGVLGALGISAIIGALLVWLSGLDL